MLKPNNHTSESRLDHKSWPFSYFVEQLHLFTTAACFIQYWAAATWVAGHLYQQAGLPNKVAIYRNGKYHKEKTLKEITRKPHFFLIFLAFDNKSVTLISGYTTEASPYL